MKKIIIEMPDSLYDAYRDVLEAKRQWGISQGFKSLPTMGDLILGTLFEDIHVLKKIWIKGEEK